MPTCFVIQPFDSGKYDKRYDDVFKPAIEAADLIAYRADRDPQVEVPIEAIEEGIRSAAICVADITTDNPNVWYELGFAFATGRPVVMVCSTERTSNKFPFDIQHRTIIKYTTEAPSDFDKLKSSLTEKVKALFNKTEAIRQIVESDQIAPTEGLSQGELLVMAILAGETGVPGTFSTPHSLRVDVEKAGLTSIGFSLGFRRLMSKKLIELTAVHHEQDYVPTDVVRVTEDGWTWIEN